MQFADRVLFFGERLKGGVNTIKAVWLRSFCLDPPAFEWKECGWAVPKSIK